ncbi:MAG: hypothetical protein IGR76_10300 [Synechococcales cyanobacterium T60_A2020_003]|nr:hypothetical protein [Synechococcales cyanobacterium T60_A2020_003]
MTLESPTEKDSSPINADDAGQSEAKATPILCRHCRRTATNGIKCQGMCVADSDY